MECPGRKMKQKISNNSNPVSKTTEHKGTLFVSANRSRTFNYFYFVILFYIFILSTFRDYLFLCTGQLGKQSMHV